MENEIAQYGLDFRPCRISRICVRCGTKPAYGRAATTAWVFVRRTWCFWHVKLTSSMSANSATIAANRPLVSGATDLRQRSPSASERAGGRPWPLVGGLVTGRRGGSIDDSPSTNRLRTRERADVGAEHDH